MTRPPPRGRRPQRPPATGTPGQRRSRIPLARLEEFLTTIIDVDTEPDDKKEEVTT